MCELFHPDGPTKRDKEVMISSDFVCNVNAEDDVVLHGQDSESHFRESAWSPANYSVAGPSKKKYFALEKKIQITLEKKYFAIKKKLFHSQNLGPWKKN